MRIGKFLARAGVCSRREAERLIAAGRVSLDGARLDTPAVRVDADRTVCVDGKRIRIRDEQVRIWRYHKPRGLLCTRSDPAGRATMFDALPRALVQLKAVGRLDMDSEGLLLLTNDGDVSRRLELPSSAVERRYRVRVRGRVDLKELASLADGTTCGGVRYGPVRARLEKAQTSANCWLDVRFAEGKNREARRVLESIGLTVNRLIRAAYGPVELGDLPRGAAQELSAASLQATLRVIR